VLTCISCRSLNDLKHSGVFTLKEPELYNSLGEIFVYREDSTRYTKGTGFVIGSDESHYFVATNYHVVDDFFEQGFLAKIRFKPGNQADTVTFHLSRAFDQDQKLLVLKPTSESGANDFAILKLPKSAKSSFVKPVAYSSNPIVEQKFVQAHIFGYPDAAQNKVNPEAGTIFKSRGAAGTFEKTFFAFASSAPGGSGSPIFLRTDKGFNAAGALYAGAPSGLFRADDLIQAAEKSASRDSSLGLLFADI
jgi:S1-C subfamily serine protease